MRISSRPNSKEYENNYDKIFAQDKPEAACAHTEVRKESYDEGKVKVYCATCGIYLKEE
jgi:hypothetical protein